jgi:hypothetical protein
MKWLFLSLICVAVNATAQEQVKIRGIEKNKWGIQDVIELNNLNGKYSLHILESQDNVHWVERWVMDWEWIKGNTVAGVMHANGGGFKFWKYRLVKL